MSETLEITEHKKHEIIADWLLGEGDIFPLSPIEETESTQLMAVIDARVKFALREKPEDTSILKERLFDRIDRLRALLHSQVLIRGIVEQVFSTIDERTFLESWTIVSHPNIPGLQENLPHVSEKTLRIFGQLPEGMSAKDILKNLRIDPHLYTYINMIFVSHGKTVAVHCKKNDGSEDRFLLKNIEVLAEALNSKKQ